jgi:hypothetical protein
VTFNINANTIVRFKYVLVDSWSRTWEVIVQPPTPEPTPEECQRILNDPNTRCTRNWCSCVEIYDPETYKKSSCCNPTDACLDVYVSPCCTGDTSSGCLDSWSGQGGRNCVTFSSGESSKPITVPWSASWSLKPGWALADIGKRVAGVSDIGCNGSSGGNSVSGTCTVNARPGGSYGVFIIVIFKKTQ